MGNSRFDSLEPFSQAHQASHLTFVPSSLNFSSPPHNNNNNNNKSPHLAHLPSSWAPPCPSDRQFPRHNQQTPPFKSFSADPILQLNNASELVHSRAVVEILQEDDPNLQLKHGSSISPTDFCPHSGAAFGGLLNGGSSAMVPLRTDNTPPSVARADAFGEQNSSIIIPVSPFSSAPITTVSGSQTVPFAHKLDSRDKQTLGFSSFSGDGGERDRARSRESVEKVKREYMGECLVKVCEGGYNTHAKICENITVKGEQEAGVTIASLEGGGMGVPVASLEDGGMGLRLGKRMYYGDAGRPQEAVRRANSNSNGSVKNGSSKSSASNSSTNNQNSITLTANNCGGGNTNKKHKSSAATTVVPKCQVEGCKADLSGARDYHRRHKVCEWHSKASKAKVNNLEQRFCQQCSRFHVLSEFDEGKRSCRRRLAGHNERRRKPPPEPMPFLLPGSFAYLADSTINGSLLNHPFFVQHRRVAPLPVSIDNALLACQLGLAEFPQQETLGNYNALECHHFLDGLPPGGGSGLGVLDAGRALMMAGGHMLSNPLEPSPSTSSPVGLIPNGSTEMAISGCALSLLSSSLTSSENPSTMAISLGMASPTIDQFLPENHVLASSHQVAGSSTSCFNSAVGMASTLHGIGHNHNSNALHSLTSSSSGCSTDVDQGEPPAMSSFDGHSMFLINSESGFQNLQDGTNPHQHGRPVLDLMQVASDTHLDHPQSEIMYADYHRLSIFGQPSIM